MEECGRARSKGQGPDIMRQRKTFLGGDGVTTMLRNSQDEDQ